MLKFATYVANPAAVGAPRRKPSDSVETLFVGPAKIVDDGLSEYVSVCDWGTNNLGSTSVQRFNAQAEFSAAVHVFEFFLKLAFQQASDFIDLHRATGILQLIFGFRD